MKKTRKKGIRSLAILLVLVLTLGFSPVTNVEAKAAPRLNYKKVTLVQGKKKRLKVRNLRRRRKVKWYSTKKSVATVNKKGVVKAKKKGKTYIVAKVGKKKYRCKVIVKKKVTKKKKKTKKSKKPVGNTKKQLTYYQGALEFPGAMKVGEKVDLINYNSDYNVNKKYRISNNVRAKYFKWYVKNKSIVSVNKYGIAVAKKVGSTKVSCRYMTEDGTWRMSKSATVIVKDAGDVNISYTTSSSTGDKDTFDTITCTVKNNSNSIIEFNRRLYGDNGYWYHFKNNVDKRISIAPGETKIISYKVYAYMDKIWNTEVPYDGSLNIKDFLSIEFPFIYKGNWVTRVHHIRGGEYWSTN